MRLSRQPLPRRNGCPIFGAQFLTQVPAAQDFTRKSFESHNFPDAPLNL
jgi:hypothetical protein